MDLIPAKSPWFLKRWYSRYTWDITTTEKVIYLTFDDGPIPEVTPWVLKQLKQYNAKATFFCIGENVDKHPDVFKQVVEDGHTIGNHTYNHLDGWQTDTDTYVENTRKAFQVMSAELNTNSKFQIPNSDNYQKQIPNQKNSELITPNSALLFRPPFGKIKKSQGRILRQLGYQIIMWDVLAKDWLLNATPEQCLKNVLNNTIQGSIVVFHDSIKASKNLYYALPKMLAHFSAQGYVFKQIPVLNQ